MDLDLPSGIQLLTAITALVLVLAVVLGGLAAVGLVLRQLIRKILHRISAARAARRDSALKVSVAGTSTLD